MERPRGTDITSSTDPAVRDSHLQLGLVAGGRYLIGNQYGKTFSNEQLFFHRYHKDSKGGHWHLSNKRCAGEDLCMGMRNKGREYRCLTRGHTCDVNLDKS